MANIWAAPRRLVASVAITVLSVTALGSLSSCGRGDAQLSDLDWKYHGNTISEQRFSPLEQINKSSVKDLGLEWELELPGEVALEATPLEVEGTIYFSGGLGSVYAVDAVTGKQVWKSEPQDFETIPAAGGRIFGVNRGVAYHAGKIFRASRDGRMIALDAKTGKHIWTTPFLKPEDRAASTGAPRVFGNNLIIGSSGGDNNGRGFVTAMDSATGKILWRWYVVPGNPATDKDETTLAAAATWSGEWWKTGGGGHAWNGMTYDPEFNQILIGTGNGNPWDCRERSDAPDKSNLYLASVVALDAKTGKYKWHYQYNPRECWDWKATADIVTGDLTIDGKKRKVLMQAPSNGFFYVIDRTNGKLISAEKYGKVNWADKIDIKTGLPVERPGIRYENAPITIYPSAAGNHNWQATAFNPDTGLIYIPYMQSGMKIERDDKTWAFTKTEPDAPRLRIGFKASGPDKALQDENDDKGALVAWDPVKQKLAWRVQHPRMWNGGLMTTRGGLVFQGLLDGRFMAYDASNGRELWKFNAGIGIIAPAITYSIKGKQYVSVLAGPGGDAVSGMDSTGWQWGVHPRRLLTFAIGGKAKLPPPAPTTLNVELLDNPAIKLDPKRVERGDMYFAATCSACHGGGAISRGGAPDLRGSAAAMDPDIFRKIVLEGALMGNGMPKFPATDEQILDTMQYIRAQARKGPVENPSWH